MRQVLTFRTDSTIFSSFTTYYLNLLAGCDIDAQFTEHNGTGIAPLTGTLRNIIIVSDAAPGAGKSWTFTVRINGSDTAHTFILANTDTEVRYTSDIALTAGDRVTLKVVRTGTPAETNLAHCSFELESANDGESGHVQWNTSLLANMTPRYLGPLSNETHAALDAERMKHIVAVAGSLAAMYAIYGIGTSADQVRLTVYKNGVAQDGAGGTVDTRLLITSNGASMQYLSTTFDLAVVPGDELYVLVDNLDGTFVDRLGTSFRFVATTDGESNFVGAKHDSATSTSGDRYGTAGGSWPWATPEGTQYQIAGVTTFTLDQWRMSMQTEPGVSGTQTFTVRNNGVASGLSLSFSNVDTFDSDLVNSTEIADGDVFNVLQSPSGTAAGSFVTMSLRQFVAPPAPPSLLVMTQLVVEVFGDEDSDDDPPEVISECAGGGTVATGTNPAAGTALTTTTTPLAWVELTLPGSPATTYRWAGGAINHGDPKEARIIDIGIVERGLSSVDGGIEAGRVSTLLSDVDGVIRGLWISGTLRHAVVDYYISDLTTVRAEGVPWRIFRGFVTECQPEGNRTFRLYCEDVLTSRLNATNGRDLELPAHIVEETIGSLDTNERMYDKPFWHVYGSVSAPGGAMECPYVGTGAIAGREDLGSLHWFLVSIGVVRVNEVLVGGLGPTPISRIQLAESAFGTYIFAPGKDGWLEANNWSVRGGRRFTLIAGTAVSAITLAKEDRIPILANVCGYEENGDASGSPYATIESPPRALLHFLNNYTAQDATGDWLTIAGASGFSLFETTSFEAVHALMAALGYECAGIIGADFQQRSWRDRVAEFLVSFGFNLGVNRHGQWMLTMLDRTDTAAGVPTYTEAHILEGSVRIDLRAGDVENEVRYVYRRNYVTPLPMKNPEVGAITPLDPHRSEWLSGLQTVRDTDSITELGGGRTGLRRSEVQEYTMVRDDDTADAVAAERLALFSPPNGRVEATCKLSLRDGAALELGDIIKLQHWDLPWTGTRRCQVRHIATNATEMWVEFVARDVDDLLA